jgi:hypothetical protein
MDTIPSTQDTQRVSFLTGTLNTLAILAAFPSTLFCAGSLFFADGTPLIMLWVLGVFVFCVPVLTLVFVYFSRRDRSDLLAAVALLMPFLPFGLISLFQSFFK